MNERLVEELISFFEEDTEMVFLKGIVLILGRDRALYRDRKND